MRIEIRQAAIEKRRIDFMLEHVEHAVNETDQVVYGGQRLLNVTIGDGVEQGNVTVDRLLEILPARNMRVMQPSYAPKNGVQRPKRMRNEGFIRGRNDQLIDPPI